MPMIYELLPDPAALPELDPEELAGPVLHVLSKLNRGDSDLHRANFLASHPNGYPPEYQEPVGEALSEAWTWRA